MAKVKGCLEAKEVYNVYSQIYHFLPCGRRQRLRLDPRRISGQLLAENPRKGWRGGVQASFL